MGDSETAMKRARHLLRPERARVDLQETPPLLPAEALGALDGAGFTSEAPFACLSVYVLMGRDQAAAALEKLQAALPVLDSPFVQHGFNGPLFYFGYTDTAGEQGVQAKYRLLRLVSALAGDE